MEVYHCAIQNLPNELLFPIFIQTNPLVTERVCKLWQSVINSNTFWENCLMQRCIELEEGTPLKKLVVRFFHNHCKIGYTLFPHLKDEIKKMNTLGGDVLFLVNNAKRPPKKNVKRSSKNTRRASENRSLDLVTTTAFYLERGDLFGVARIKRLASLYYIHAGSQKAFHQEEYQRVMTLLVQKLEAPSQLDLLKYILAYEIVALYKSNIFSKSIGFPAYYFSIVSNTKDSPDTFEEFMQELKNPRAFIQEQTKKSISSEEESELSMFFLTVQTALRETYYKNHSHQEPMQLD